jgi:hypothetical protein
MYLSIHDVLLQYEIKPYDIGFCILQISSIKSGMWDCMSDTLQTTSQQELTQIRMKRCSVLIFLGAGKRWRLLPLYIIQTY